MTSTIPNKLEINCFAPPENLNARQALEKMRRFLIGLEKVSPWRRPFDVSGSTAEHANMPIAADLSEFDSVAMVALRDAEQTFRFINPDKDNFNLDYESQSLSAKFKSLNIAFASSSGLTRGG